MKWINYYIYNVYIYLGVLAAFILIAPGLGGYISAAADSSAAQRVYTVIIDPGHGGEDGGAVSCTGVAEKEINLQISLRLNSMLRLLGYQTKMVRQTDQAIHTEGSTIAARKASDLRNRAALVNDTDNSVLVSIHQNKFPVAKYSGAQVFYALSSGSDKFAKLVQDQLREALDTKNNRQIKAGKDLYLLENIQQPGIMVECGFLSNPEEETLLRNERYQKKLACVLAASISQYLTEMENMV
jgi:N-acetylmuramoyl-L-alanine amidase